MVFHCSECNVIYRLRARGDSECNEVIRTRIQSETEREGQSKGQTEVLNECDKLINFQISGECKSSEIKTSAIYKPSKMPPRCCRTR